MVERIYTFKVTEDKVEMINTQTYNGDIQKIQKFLEGSEWNSDVKPPVPYTKDRYEKTSLPYQLGEILINLVEKRCNTYQRYRNNADHRELLIQKQAYSFDKMLHKEHVEAIELIEVLQWSQESEFWEKNIRSADKFREKYSTLLRQMKEDGVGSMAPDSNPELTKKIIGIFRALIANPQYNPSPGQKVKFIQARERMENYFCQTDIDESYWPEYLLQCLEKQYLNKGDTVYPGHLCSEFTWDVLMPQYLAELGMI